VQDGLFTDRPELVKPDARAAELVSFIISHAAGQLTGNVVQRPSTERLSDEAESSHRDFVTVMLTRTLMPRPRPGPSRPRPRPRPGPSRPGPRPRPSRPRTRPSKPRLRTNKLSLLIPFLSYNTLTHKMIQYNTRFPARKANLCNILLRKHAMQLQQSSANRNHVQCTSTTEAFNVRMYQAVSKQSATAATG
jgi:hypothetical protein